MPQFLWDLGQSISAACMGPQQSTPVASSIESDPRDYAVIAPFIVLGIIGICVATYAVVRCLRCCDAEETPCSSDECKALILGVGPCCDED